MNWNDVDRILYEGTKEQIDKVRCPECGGNLRYSYSHKAKSVEINCKSCGAAMRENGVDSIPNFALATA